MPETISFIAIVTGALLLTWIIGSTVYELARLRWEQIECEAEHRACEMRNKDDVS